MVTKVKKVRRNGQNTEAEAIIQQPPVIEARPVEQPAAPEVIPAQPSASPPVALKPLPAVQQSITPGKPHPGPKNAAVWIHPDHIGGYRPAAIQLDRLKPMDNMLPRYYCYSFWDFGARKPLWYWMEEKYTDPASGEIKYICVPYEPEPDESLTAREVWDACEWKAAHRYKHAKGKLGEILRIGMLMLFAGILIVALFLIANP